jgi:hypothetical protein
MRTAAFDRSFQRGPYLAEGSGMASANPDITVGTFALFHPDAIQRLVAIGIDLQLEHNRSVSDACAMRDINPHFFMLDALDDDREGAPGLDWDTVRPAKGAWEPAAFLSL